MRERDRLIKGSNNHEFSEFQRTGENLQRTQVPLVVIPFVVCCLHSW